MPILKQLVTNSANSKRRSRADLTAEMISAPLGDFRHTMHVGRAGDAFGDTSFLNSKAGEGEQEVTEEVNSSSKPGLLSRKFRSSKRSQSVTRGERRDMLGSLRDSAIFVKNAVSLPQLTEKEPDRSGGKQLPKSLSSSPVKKASEEKTPEEKHMNGGAAALGSGPHSPGLEERDFGDITDLPLVVPKSSYGMKHAESIMSFHIDLGPSMLGDVLSIMDKDPWEQEDSGYHGVEDPQREAGPVEALMAHWLGQESKLPQDSLVQHDDNRAATYSPGSARSTTSRLTMDSSSVSSCASVGEEQRSLSSKGHNQGIPEDSRHDPAKQPEKEFSFMDEEDDEIRV
ncbi:cdc42 effector protein 4 [Rhineura floridana]|uniref:cdc42 effector protein 4 n=1 Tax=Rhineura floridana TaxID=261503 RepID=UPI002AC802C5|nr:cdc42 effector protein 4 [Rhineura floridana]XP_061471672.1 cdc42 effector protein 4 [Rhineura floridana]XP_061471673.1 cdc42 effector protein 4 [Rhineura floridana]XP_061471674.1 cdc42 effector protein 4 [Rhineura floridana]XP_061471675.1 cdc42 effector protein 4 [Rhineura floridana]XP_061471676.1 cdc42 effector protein 4 [Rhineura floridana]